MSVDNGLQTECCQHHMLLHCNQKTSSVWNDTEKIKPYPVYPK